MNNNEKIARICWNNNHWTKPSGRIGKSKNKKLFEYNGYGHEEWLFDLSKLIKGYHYGWLQPIATNWKKYNNNQFNISIYSINSKTNEKWWIGKIKNVKVITCDESKKIQKYYKKYGWFDEMYHQLTSIELKVKKSEINKMRFCIKYKPSDLILLDEPLKISKNDKAITSFYYVLLNKKVEPTLEKNITNKFIFKAHNSKRTNKNKIKVYSNCEYEIEFLHNKMIENSMTQLKKKFGNKNVSLDVDTGYGTEIDICVKLKTGYILYEFKTANLIKKCIREALGQIIEYAYYPKPNRINKLIIVSHNNTNKNIILYLKTLREQFKMPIFYQKYNIESNSLEEVLF